MMKNKMPVKKRGNNYLIPSSIGAFVVAEACVRVLLKNYRERDDKNERRDC